MYNRFYLSKMFTKLYCSNANDNQKLVPPPTALPWFPFTFLFRGWFLPLCKTRSNFIIMTVVICRQNMLGWMVGGQGCNKQCDVIIQKFRVKMTPFQLVGMITLLFLIGSLWNFIGQMFGSRGCAFYHNAMITSSVTS